jgi:putative lipoic acid-binding regulatory protein
MATMRTELKGFLYICKKERMEKESEEFYGRLKEELLRGTEWPSNYLYKFIVPTEGDKTEKIEAIFDNTGAVIETKKSKNGKYTSLSITVHLENPDQVIEKYIEVGKVEGVISL